MKRLTSTLIPLLSVAFLLMGADLKPKAEPVVTKPHCSGYSIIEAGVAIDCNGDTVKLVRRAGFYELAANTNNQTR